ncbi:hypothetical protein [Streptomyces griseiscabiei]|uniref:hypothetical protein n=1 Tax=Streptomyces griseiscabiei TaxID=2993540 RepID=UPI003872FBF4
MYDESSGRSAWSMRSRPQVAPVWVSLMWTVLLAATAATAGSAASRFASASVISVA